MDHIDTRSSIPEPAETRGPHALLRRNFSANLFHNSLVGFSSSLISAGVILPLFISSLSSSKVLLGLIMTISFAGWLVPQVFTAPLVASFRQVRRLLLPSVLLAERLPLLLLGPAMYWLGSAAPSVALLVFFLLYAWFCFGSGFNAVGLQELYARIIPVELRGRLSGVSGAIGIGLALAGAAVSRVVLAGAAFPVSYAALFTLAGICSLAAWLGLLWIREPRAVSQPAADPAPSDSGNPSPPAGDHPRPESLAAFLRKIPGLLRADPNYTRFLAAMALLYLGGMSGVFLAVAARDRFALPDSVVVTFPVALYIGQALGSLLCGWIADRRGYKILQIIANAANVILLIVAIFARAPWLFYVVFALKGLSTAADILGNLITLEFTGPELRPAYIGIYNTASGLVFTFSPLLAGWLAERLGYDGLFWITAFITAGGIALLQIFVRDPRHLRARASS